MKTPGRSQDTNVHETQPAQRSSRRLRWLVEQTGDMWILLVLIAVTVAMASLSPVFLTAENLLENVARPAAIVALITVGMTFVIASRGLDLSVGSNAALSSTIGILAIDRLGLSVPAGIALTLLAGMSFGVVNAFFITKVRVAPFIVTLGMLSVGRGLTLVITGSSFTYGLPDAYREWGRGSFGIFPIPLVLMVIVWLLGSYVFNATRVGIYARSIGSNETATRLAGVEVDRYKTFYYMFVGMLAALAGALWSARANTISVTTGMGTELDTIAAVIIGGTSLFGGSGTVTGSILGAFTLAVLANGLRLFGVNALVQRIVVGFVIIGALSLGAWRRERIERSRASRVPHTSVSRA